MHAVLSSKMIVVSILPEETLNYFVYVESMTLTKHILYLPREVLKVLHYLMMLLLWFALQISMK